MKTELIKFGTPGKSGNIYSFNDTDVPTEVDFKILDIRKTNYFNMSASDLEEYTIGKCQLVKDEEGVWIVGYESIIKITDELLSKSSNRYWAGATGRQMPNNEKSYLVENAKVLFVYLSVEEDINVIIRDLKLTEIGV